jgi:hypothetical protein
LPAAGFGYSSLFEEKLTGGPGLVAFATFNAVNVIKIHRQKLFAD